MEKVSRQTMVQNSRAKFYDNLNQVYKDNATAPKLEAPAPSKKTINLTSKSASTAARQQSQTDMNVEPQRKQSANKPAESNKVTKPVNLPNQNTLKPDQPAK